MAEEIIIHKGNKREKYEALLPQMEGLLSGESDRVANMANFVAALKTMFGFFWVGFYVAHDNELVLAPFQGPVACTRIRYGKGVCGTAWKEKRTLVVEDVDTFPGHIACRQLRFEIGDCRPRNSRRRSSRSARYRQRHVCHIRRYGCVLS